jgi:hemophore-related protein
MRTIVVASAGGTLLAAILAVTVATPPSQSQAAVQPVRLSSGVVTGTAAGDATRPTRASGSAASSVDPSSGAAVPASSATSRPPAPPLTDQQKALIDEYLAAHPGRAQVLAATAARWKAFADANPELAAELQKVAALPPDQRKDELSGWFAAHPEQKAAFQDWVKQTRADRVERRHDRRDRRQDRRERRQDRRENRRDGATTPAPSTSGSAQTTSAQV